MLTKFLLIGCTLNFILWSAIIDSEHLLQNQFIYHHRSRWILRATFVATIAIFCWKYAIVSALLFAGLFDQVLNIARGKHFLYLGTVAYWDKFFSKRIRLYVFLKLSMIVAAMYLLFFC